MVLVRAQCPASLRTIPRIRSFAQTQSALSSARMSALRGAACGSLFRRAAVTRSVPAFICTGVSVVGWKAARYTSSSLRSVAFASAVTSVAKSILIPASRSVKVTKSDGVIGRLHTARQIGGACDRGIQLRTSPGVRWLMARRASATCRMHVVGWCPYRTDMVAIQAASAPGLTSSSA